MRSLIVSCFSLSLIFVSNALCKGQGVVSGQVFADDGKPADKVEVGAHILNGKIDMLVDKFAYSDIEGHFLINGLDFGKYQLTAEKPDDYPMFPKCFYDALYQSAKRQTVIVSKENPVAEVEIHLPPKAGKVTGVISSQAGTVIYDGELRLRVTLRGNTNCWLEATIPQTYSLLIPSNVDFDLTIRSTQFDDWSYKESFNGAALHVEPREKIVVNMKLRSSFKRSR